MEQDYTLPKKIIESENLTFEKMDKNKYIITFSIQNNFVYLKKLINFDMMKILYELNKDVIDDFKIEKIDDNHVENYVLIKHFFSDFGFPQKYSRLSIEKIDDPENNAILFFCKNSHEINSHHDNACEILNVEHIFLKCKLIGEHCVKFENNIIFHNEIEVPAFVEKFAGIVVSKMFIKVKQFIEKLRIT